VAKDISNSLCIGVQQTFTAQEPIANISVQQTFTAKEPFANISV
jgi:hypothetical protein